MQKQDKDQPLAVRLARSLASSGATSLNDPKFASYLDSCDQLAQFRDNFSFPKRRTVWPQEYRALKEKTGEADDEDAVAPLGLMPKRTPELLSEELNVWAASGVLGHTDHAYSRPWIKIDETVTPILAEMVGASLSILALLRSAKPSEVACMGSLTGNLHTLFTSFYRPTPQRHKIMYEGKAFPSDAYAFASHVALHEYPPSSLLPVFAREGEFSIRTEDILRLIEEEGDSVAVICFGAVQYYNGEWFDMEKITKAGHAKGCIVAFDCAHAAGNVPLKLHDWGVDFACWCSYKYLNSGPGGIAGLFVHERWEERKRLTGWWGHDKETRFSMPATFSPLPGAAGWQFSNPSVLDVVSLLASLQIFDQAANYLPRVASGGQIESRGHILGALREKSVDLTGYFELLLTSSPYFVSPDQYPPAASSPASKHASTFTIITPAEPSRRGCQLSLLFSPGDSMDWIFDSLREKGVLGDERRPGVIRFGPTPLYNSWTDVNEAARALDESLKEYGVWKRGLEGQGVERLQLDEEEAGVRSRTGEDVGFKR
ncbi:SPOSA6832_02928 [Sporobolomyces salmonicolor]|uniref:Kynureninase n=1 Tax=Sporidiobolus salmonicolor TaxID=5005 RepID=A0A0D6ENC7_SPOSA|nr:SPOSA6832_02928 [Sporobolomyces salmonicolor]